MYNPTDGFNSDGLADFVNSVRTLMVTPPIVAKTPTQCLTAGLRCMQRYATSRTKHKLVEEIFV